MNSIWKSMFAMVGIAFATQSIAQVTFYERLRFEGPSFTTETRIINLDSYGFNNRAMSAVVLRDRWEVCEEIRFNGRCMILRPGRYPSLASMGLFDPVSSVRSVSRDELISDKRYAPLPLAVYDFRRGRSERLYEANVISVRAVLGLTGQRCWVDREQILQDRNSTRIQGATASSGYGSILGYQGGSERSHEFAAPDETVASSINGRGNGRPNVYNQNVRRCVSEPGQVRPEYWDVTYSFRGVDHRIQMTNRPGATVMVNDQGEPRV